MPITTCTSCEKAYEAWSEESANEPGRLCPECDAIEARDAALGLHEMTKDLEKENAALRTEATRLKVLYENIVTKYDQAADRIVDLSTRLILADAVVEAAGNVVRDAYDVSEGFDDLRAALAPLLTAGDRRKDK